MMLIPIILIIILGLSIFWYLFDKKLARGDTLERAYTRFTFGVLIISLMSLLIGVTINIYLVNDMHAAYKAQAKGIPPTNPTLSFESITNIFASYNLVGFASLGNDTFLPIQPSITIFAMNDGLKSTGIMSFDLKEERDRFIGDGKPTEIKGLGDSLIYFKLRYKECEPAYSYKDYNKQISGKCNYNNLEGGLMKWYLEVDCIGCKFEKNPKCYSFNICVNNGSEISERKCENKLSGSSKLIPLDKCPESFS